MIPTVRSTLPIVIVATYVIDAAFYVWRLGDDELIDLVLVTGAPGYLLAGYWAVALTVGPLACVQLWRRHRAGLTGSIVVVGGGLALDVSSYLFADARLWTAQLPSALARIGVILFLLYALRDPSQEVSKAPAA
jgi:hypothetical protein